jgi:tetratricopeptide (TPR) repeat protein
MWYTDKVQIPMPTNGARWSTYNVLSHIDIVGNGAANLSGDWHVDVYLDGDKILTEYFSISGGQPPIALENQYLYNPSKYDKAMSKGDALSNQGRYDEAINAYEGAINLDPNDFQNWQAWNGKGNALSKQHKKSLAPLFPARSSHA